MQYLIRYVKKNHDNTNHLYFNEELKELQNYTSKSGGWTAGVTTLTGSGSGGGGDGGRFSCTSGDFSYSMANISLGASTACFAKKKKKITSN